MEIKKANHFVFSLNNTFIRFFVVDWIMIKQVNSGHSERLSESECSTCFNLFMLFGRNLYSWTIWKSDQDLKTNPVSIILDQVDLHC